MTNGARISNIPFFSHLTSPVLGPLAPNAATGTRQKTPPTIVAGAILENLFQMRQF
jgi:hypothetical protein